ncbi:MAG: family P-type ATPase, partial [Modestobacter sp.]|nr:family P-type ATPase [Modestobacter sp.]
MAGFGTVRALTALGPELVGASARTSWKLAGGTVSVASRAGRALAAAPAAVVREATALLDREPTRRVWSADGRAHLEVWGLQDPVGAAVATEVQDSLKALSGVSWARVDVVTRRAVVRFDPAQLTVADLLAAVEGGERATGVTAPGYPHDDPSSPADAAPVASQALALASDLAGLSAAVAGKVARLPSLPGSAAAAVVLVDNQPRLRRLVESRLGPPATDLVLAVSNAVAWALTGGAPSLVVDSAQRTQALLAARARRTAFISREGELWAEERPARHAPLDRAARPRPLPPGPVERYADRAAAGSLLAAGGLLAATGSLDLAGRALLIGAPKAARAARESFADTLTAGLSRRGLVVLDPAALRRLDRVDTVLVDSAVLHDDRPLVVSAQPTADRWTAERVWSTSQRLLSAGAALPRPPTRGQRRPPLSLVPSPDQVAPGLARHLLLEDGTPVGDVLVGTELDPYADAVMSGGQSGALRLVLTADAAAPELAGRADEVLEGADRLFDEVRRLQARGQVVALVSAQEDALGAADVGIGIVPPRGRIPWAADLVCGPGLLDVPRLLAAIPAARAVSSRGVTAATAATFLGGLLLAVGGPGRGSRAVLPVTTAAAAAHVLGTVAARRICLQPVPEPVPHTPWHALEVDEVLARLPSPAPRGGMPHDTGLAARLGPTVGSVVAPLTALTRNVAAELADPLTPVLATGAVASAVIGSPTDALLVGGVLAANAAISGAQRLRADQALRTLLSKEQLLARVVIPPPDVDPSRDGAAVASGSRQVPAGALRAGQVIDLQPGDVVPADARLLHQSLLEVDEAGLTGESVAIPKQTEAAPGAELADRACMVYEGTTVLTGTGRAVVVAVGAATVAGRALALDGR